MLATIENKVLVCENINGFSPPLFRPQMWANHSARFHSSNPCSSSQTPAPYFQEQLVDETPTKIKVFLIFHVSCSFIKRPSSFEIFLRIMNPHSVSKKFTILLYRTVL